MRVRILMAGLAATAATLAVGSAPAQAASGCNHSVCVYTAYTGSGYQVWGEFTKDVHDGHIDFWGPGRPRISSPNGYWPARHDTIRYSGSGSGQVCAEGWSRIGGKWYSIGLPCVTV